MDIEKEKRKNTQKKHRPEIRDIAFNKVDYMRRKNEIESQLHVWHFAEPRKITKMRKNNPSNK